MLKNKFRHKKAQEEIVGFALIIIVVAVILLIFLGIWLKNSDQESVVQSYELDSFMQVFLEYTVDCLENFETDQCLECTKRYYSIRELSIACYNKEKCLDEVDTCEVLETKSKDIIDSIWKVSENSPVKGYKLKISSKNESLVELNKGTLTNNYKTSVQRLGKENLQIRFDVNY